MTKPEYSKAARADMKAGFALMAMEEKMEAASAMLAALKRSLHLIEKADADSGCLAYTEIAQQHRAAIAQAEAAGIKEPS